MQRLFFVYTQTHIPYLLNHFMLIEVWLYLAFYDLSDLDSLSKFFIYFTFSNSLIVFFKNSLLK